MRMLAAALMLCVSCLAAQAGDIVTCNKQGCSERAAPTRSYSARRHVRGDPRPARWCAWWLRRHLHIPRSAFPPYRYNLARAFRRIGSPAGGPGKGVIVVWRHHVGIITGRTSDGRWIVKSGNDGHRVRERPRSLRGVIAFRRLGQRWASR